CQLNINHPPIPQIYASEVNERAVWLFKRNLISNKCENITILKGDFRDYIDKMKSDGIQFQAIYTNPPLKTGHDVMLELFEGAMSLLAPNGFIQYIHMKKLGAPGFLKKLKQLRPEWHYLVIKKKAGFHVILVSPKEMDIIQEKSELSGYF
ncbi:MAG: methyltransferase, partial [Promethearchaeota archaeon]